MLSVIKEEYKDSFIAFGGKGLLVLGNRQDLDDLAIMAHTSQDPTLLAIFKVLPPLEDLKKHKVDQELASIRPEVAQAPAAPVTPVPDDAKKEEVLQEKSNNKPQIKS